MVAVATIGRFFYMRIELLRAKVGETRTLSSINHFFSLTLSTIR